MNLQLAKQRNLSDESIELIKDLHRQRTKLMGRAKRFKKADTIRRLAKEATALEYRLQEAWGFPLDARFHKFWLLPHCSCPQMDNEERYGTGYAVYSSECLIHGEGV